MSPAGTDDGWDRVDRLFQAALERPAEERFSFLTDACGDDDELFGAVRDLLETADAAGAFLEASSPAGMAEALDEVAENADRAIAGMRIGRYRIVRRIGRGGMGTVYLAERADGRFDREVALKVLRRGVDTEDVLRRFLSERRILATLEHPNIARLLDAGETHDGRPYLVMEHVQGRPIDRYCDEERLTLDERLELFATAADAVDHAHHRLVVHRDLKPSNILVTDDGTVKLLDFGIAKLLDDADAGAERTRTRSGLRVLTPEYASPEQLRGQTVTTASDVYQLGLLLYRLISGRLPHDPGGGDLLDRARAVVNAPPPAPSAALPPDRDGMRRRIRGDVDAIVLKALRAEPEGRYSSVERLVDDVRRYLLGQPVGARHGTLRYRTRKFVQRNPAVVSAGLVIALLLAAYVVTLTSYSNRLERERAAAEVEARRAERITEFVTGIFEYATPDATRGSQVTARELLDAGTERIRRELDAEPALRAELLSTTAGVYRSLGLDATARPLAEEALHIRRGLFGTPHPDVLDSQIQLAIIVGRTDRDSARTLYTTALEDAERIHGPRSPEVARVLTLLGAYGGLDGPERIAVFDRAIAILRAAGDTARDRLADALVLSTQGSDGYPMAVERDRLQEALAIYRQRFGPEDARVGETLNDMALLLEDADPPAADTLLRNAIEIHRAAMGETHPTTLTLMNNYAAVLRDRGELFRAEDLYRRVLALRRQAHPDDAVNLAYTLYGLGWVLNRVGGVEEAETLLREASTTFRPGDARRRLIRAELAKSLEQQGRPMELEAIR